MITSEKYPWFNEETFNRFAGRYLLPAPVGRIIRCSVVEMPRVYIYTLVINAGIRMFLSEKEARGAAVLHDVVTNEKLDIDGSSYNPDITYLISNFFS